MISIYIALAALVFAIAACEFENLYRSTTCLVIQSIILSVSLYRSISVADSTMFTISTVVVIPLIIYISIRKTKFHSEAPFLDGTTSLGILLILFGIFSLIGVFRFSQTLSIKAGIDLSMLAVLILVAGVYTMIAKADLIKLGIGLTMASNGVHLMVLRIETSIVDSIGMTAVSVLMVILVTGLAVSLYDRTKSLDIRKLVQLRW